MSVEHRWILRAEEQLGVRFPGAYRARMMRKNAGEVSLDSESWWLYPIRDETNPSSIRKTADDVVTATRTARADGLGFPDDGVVIAHNGADDLLFVRGHDEELGREVWEFRMRGGESRIALDDIIDLDG